MPHGARCAVRRCPKKAKHPRLLGELILMQDGTIHEAVEWVCEEHSD